MISMYPECQCVWGACTHPIRNGDVIDPWIESPCFQTARYLVASITKDDWTHWGMPPQYMCDQCSTSWLNDFSVPVMAVDIECLSPHSLWFQRDGLIKRTWAGNFEYSLLLLDDGTPNVRMW